MADISKINPGNGTTYSIKDASAMFNLSVSGTNLTVTRRNNTTFTVSLPADTKQTISASTGKVYLTGVASTSTTSVGYANANVYMSNSGLVASSLSVTNATVSGTATVSTAKITNLQATTSTISNVTITNATVSTMTVSTINGGDVGDSPKFTDTDTTYTVTVSGTGNALSTIGLSGTTITATLSSFATSGHNHDSVYSPVSHTHGNILNDGKITTSNSIANGDAIVISRTTSGTISKSTITFDDTTTN